MAVTITLYNNAVKRLVNKEVTLTTLKAMLLDDNAAALFDATDTDLSGISAAEVSGSGWDSGGETLQSVAVTTVNTNDAKLAAANLSVTATGGAIGPALSMAVYDDTDASDAPLFFVDFGEAKTADEGTPFNVDWHANGIITFTYS